MTIAFVDRTKRRMTQLERAMFQAAIVFIEADQVLAKARPAIAAIHRRLQKEHPAAPCYIIFCGSVISGVRQVDAIVKQQIQLPRN